MEQPPRRFSRSAVLTTAFVLLCGAVSVPAQDEGLTGSGDAAEIIDSLFQEYDPRITPEIRARAQAYVVGRGKGITPGKAWNDHAVGRHLVGAASVAVWAGLNAVRTELRGEFVANCGTFLVEAGRFRVGLELLRQANAMGHDTAYLHEAMAAAHDGLGEHAAATNEIETAARLDPTDAAIRVQKSLLQTGKPPAPPSDRKKDDLDTAFGELEEHILYVTREIRILAGALDRWEKAAGFPPDENRAEWVAGHVVEASESRFSAVRGAIERARSKQSPFSEQSLEWRNAALLNMVIAYGYTTRTLLNSLDDLNADWSFWASVAGRGKGQYIRDLHRDLKYNFRYEEPNDIPQKTNNPASYITDIHGSSLDFMLLMYPQRVAFKEALCDLGITCATKGPHRGVPCGSWAEEFTKLEATVELRLRNAAPRFDAALAGVLSWNRLVVLDARRYANKWLGKLQRGKGSSSAHEFMRNMEKNMIESIGRIYGELMPFQPQFFVNGQVFNFEAGRNRLFESLDYERQRLSDCKPPRLRKLAEFSKEELEAKLKELNELMKKDLEAKYEFKPECTAKIDGISATYDAKNGVKLDAGSLSVNQGGDASIKVGDFEVGTKGATGVTVEVGHSISGGEGLVGNVSIKITGEWDAATGEWGAVAEVGGKIGVGVAVPEVGELACYPGGGTVTLNARSFIRKEIMMQRVSEELARR